MLIQYTATLQTHQYYSKIVSALLCKNTKRQSYYWLFLRLIILQEQKGCYDLTGFRRKYNKIYIDFAIVFIYQSTQQQIIPTFIHAVTTNLAPLSLV